MTPCATCPHPAACATVEACRFTGPPGTAYSVTREEMEAMRQRVVIPPQASPMDIQGVLSAVQCGDISTGRAREMIEAWLAGRDINPMFPAPDVPNPFGMDDNPAEVVNRHRAAFQRIVDMPSNYGDETEDMRAIARVELGGKP